MSLISKGIDYYPRFQTNCIATKGWIAPNQGSKEAANEREFITLLSFCWFGGACLKWQQKHQRSVHLNKTNHIKWLNIKLYFFLFQDNRLVQTDTVSNKWYKEFFIFLWFLDGAIFWHITVKSDVKEDLTGISQYK